MTTGQTPTSRDGHGGALRVDVAVDHPECWIIELSDETDVGVLGRGVYPTGERRANTHVTLVSDRQSTLDEAIAVVRASEHTTTVARMTPSPDRHRPVAPGKATEELLVEHDPTTQVSGAFLSRGFVYGAPVEVRDGVEHWTLLTHNERHAIRSAFDDVRDLEAATIDVRGIAEVQPRTGAGTLPLSRLSPRQREVFQLAQRRGYYAHPKRATASDLATELDVTTSTVHEHLHKAEQTLLDRS